MNYINDIIRSGMAEKATLIKRPYENNEFGDPDYDDSEEERYVFKTVVNHLDRQENEQEAGDFIEGDIRFFVSPDCDIEFINGDFIKYNNREFNVTEVRKKTVGDAGYHEEVIAENATKV